METFFVIVIVLLAISFYFLPSMIASIRHSEHGAGIFWVNFLFGWTVLGWFAALIWAVTERIEDRVITTSHSPLEQQASRVEPGRTTESKDRSIGWYVGLFAIVFAGMTLLAWLVTLLKAGRGAGADQGFKATYVELRCFPPEIEQEQKAPQGAFLLFNLKQIGYSVYDDCAEQNIQI
jgi:hypothetical protein